MPRVPQLGHLFLIGLDIVFILPSYLVGRYFLRFMLEKSIFWYGSGLVWDEVVFLPTVLLLLSFFLGFESHGVL